MKFVVLRTDVTAEHRLGLSYPLTPHAPDGTRLVGFDNAHPVRERRDPGSRRRGEADHWHRMRMVETYQYKDASTLFEDFWRQVTKVLRQRGAIP